MRWEGDQCNKTHVHPPFTTFVVKGGYLVCSGVYTLIDQALWPYLNPLSALQASGDRGRKHVVPCGHTNQRNRTASDSLV